LELHHLYLPGAQGVVLDQVTVKALYFGGVWTLNFVDVTVLASNQDLCALRVPLEVVDLGTIWKLQHTDGIVLSEIKMTVHVKEKYFAVATGRNK
jgi:hypothetical protein